MTVQAAAAIAVAATGTIPQLGFVHEDSGQSFVLDIADVRRHDVVLDIAFGAAKEAAKRPESIDRLVRRRAAEQFRRRDVVPGLIDVIKTVLAAREEQAESDGTDAGREAGAEPAAGPAIESEPP